MKFSIMKPVLVLLAAAQLLGGCSKEAAQPDPLATQAVTQQATTPPTNPYDYLGELHNQGLDYFLLNASAQNADQQTATLSLDFLQGQGYDRTDMTQVLESPEVATLLTSSDKEATLRQALSANGMNLELGYYNQMTAAIHNASSAAEVVDELATIEQAVNQDRTLTASSRTALLAGLAVGQHSAQYWYAQAEAGDDSPWLKKFGGNPVDTDPGSGIKMNIDWGDVVSADLTGAIQGGLSCLCLHGAIVGGLTASAVEIVKQVFEDKK